MSGASRYKAALVALLAGVPCLAAADKVAGAILPDDAVKVAELRYEVPRSYEETLKFFRQVYGPGKYRRRPIADLPTVKAVHIENPDARPGQWEGLNVYEQKGVTRVYVLVKAKQEIGGSSNGRTPDSGSGYLGSNPSPPASSAAPARR